MLVAFGELTPLFWAIAGIAALFLIQLLLCMKANKLAVKLIPVYLILAVLAYSAATYLGVFGTYSLGALSGNELAGLLLLFVAGIAAVGPLLAWAVCGIIRLVRRDGGLHG